MALIKELDYGTPEPRGPYGAALPDVTLTIDGQSVTVPEGTSIMRAAQIAGTTIPKLCATDSLEAFGSCRLCLVEIQGRNGTPASCTTPVAPAMSCNSQSPLAAQVRQSSGWSEM